MITPITDFQTVVPKRNARQSSRVETIQQTKLENGQKPIFCLFGSFKNTFAWILNDPSRPANLAQTWKTLSTITTCNIKSIQDTKVQEMAGNLFLALWIIQKCRFVIFE